MTIDRETVTRLAQEAHLGRGYFDGLWSACTGDLEKFAALVLKHGHKPLPCICRVIEELGLAMGTLESRDRNIEAMAEEYRRLAAERDALKLSRLDQECLRIGQEIQRAASELPECFSIRVEVERLAGWVELYGTDDEQIQFNDHSDGLSHSISLAIDSAISASKERA